IFAISYIAAWSIGAYWLRRETREYIDSPTIDVRVWLTSAVPMTIMNGSSLLNQHADIVILRQFAIAEDVGLYKVALSSVILVTFGLQAINSVLAPRYGQAYHSGNTGELQQLARLAFRAGLITALPVMIVFLFAPSWLLEL